MTREELKEIKTAELEKVNRQISYWEGYKKGVEEFSFSLLSIAERDSINDRINKLTKDD